MHYASILYNDHIFIFFCVPVGAGSAGSVVANRLSANYSVLLLEAGGEPHPLHLIPAFSSFLLNYPEVDWQHKTVPQKHSTFAQNHRVTVFLRMLQVSSSTWVT